MAAPQAGPRRAWAAQGVGAFVSSVSDGSMGLSRADLPDQVRRDRRRWLGSLGLDPGAVIVAGAVHGSAMARITSAPGQPPGSDPLLVQQVDGLLTDLPEVVLMMVFADCLPICLFDSRRRALALVHAGWRGSLKRIAALAVGRMASEFGSRPQDLLAYLGPSICADCYGVGADVAGQFEAEFGTRHLVRRSPPGWSLDLPGLNRWLLETSGVRQITEARSCTYQDTGLYSHRRLADGKRFAVVARLC